MRGVIVYVIFGLSVLGFYGFSCLTGRDLGATSADARTMPPGSRLAGGGYRAAPIFWYGGTGGGK